MTKKKPFISKDELRKQLEKAEKEAERLGSLALKESADKSTIQNELHRVKNDRDFLEKELEKAVQRVSGYQQEIYDLKSDIRNLEMDLESQKNINQSLKRRCFRLECAAKALIDNV